MHICSSSATDTRHATAPSSDRTIACTPSPAPPRCHWADPHSPLYLDYHDTEWGRPVYDDQKLFEMLILEGFQAGLSWITVLKKRPAFRQAFDSFDPQLVAAYDDAKIAELLQNPAIIRNKRKIQAAIRNAQVFLSIQSEYGSFSHYIWHFTDNQTIPLCGDTVPVSTPLSDTISRDLKRRGMSFVGTTIIYSYLQAIGVVNDHEPGCYLHNADFKTAR